MEYIKKAFDLSEIDAKLVARYCTVLLWAIASLYLIALEFSKTKTDWLVLFTTPLILGIVITLPVLAFYAIRSHWLGFIAAIPLIMAAVIGSSLMLYGTISRQSEYRDANVINIDADNKKRIDLEKRLVKNHAYLDEELQLKKKKCNTNANFDCNEILRSISVYQDAVEGVKRDLDKLGKIQKPLAGENRIAEFVSYLWSLPIDKAEHLVASIVPLLFGLFAEFGAFATAIYGFHGMKISVGKSNYFPQGTLENKVKRVEYLKHYITLDLSDIDKRVALNELEQAKKDLMRNIEKG